MEYMLQIHINQRNGVKKMYNSHPAPPGLQITMEKQQFYIAFTPWYISSGLIN